MIGQDPDPTCQVITDPDPYRTCQVIWIRIRILIGKKFRVRADQDPQYWSFTFIALILNKYYSTLYKLITCNRGIQEAPSCLCSGLNDTLPVT